MEKTEKISVFIRKIREEDEGFFVESEKIDGNIHELYNLDIINIINSIKKNDEDAGLLAEYLFKQLDAILNGLSRPEDTGIEWLIVKKHAPDPIWPSITYFGPTVVRAILWHVCLETPKIKNLIDRNILRIEYF